MPLRRLGAAKAVAGHPIQLPWEPDIPEQVSSGEDAPNSAVAVDYHRARNLTFASTAAECPQPTLGERFHLHEHNGHRLV
jgi:hypothetical protein